MSNLWVDGTPAGTQFVVLGTYSNGSFVDTLPAQPIESSQLVVFGTTQCNDGRCLHIAWFNVATATRTWGCCRATYPAQL